jgi:hypothetical protein
MPDVDKAFEAAARALCRLDGHPENIRFEGRPMWQSYLPAARVAIEAALPHLRGT